MRTVGVNLKVICYLNMDHGSCLEVVVGKTLKWTEKKELKVVGILKFGHMKLDLMLLIKNKVLT